MATRGQETARVEGMETLLRNLEKMPMRVARKHNRKTVRAAAAPVAKKARATVKAPSKKKREARGYRGRSGLLSKSLKIKVIGSKTSMLATAIVGPDKAISAPVPQYGKKYDHRPAMIAHLVEGGHAGPGPAPPHPFLRPAWERSLPESQKIMADKSWAAIQQEAEKPA